MFIIFIYIVFHSLSFSPSGQEEGQATAQAVVTLIPMHGSQKPAVHASVRLGENISPKQPAKNESWSGQKVSLW